MFRLEPASYSAAHALYRTMEDFFPLIGAVLLGEQDGLVFVDDPEVPRQVYVEHAFGFAQTFGGCLPKFEAALRDYLLVGKSFAVAKVRLYTPRLPDFLRHTEWESLRSERQRFILNTGSDCLADGLQQSPPAGIQVRGVCWDNVAEIEARFGVVSRFWRSPGDFIDKAHAVVALVRQEPAAICYAAAVADGRAEIDVLTLPKYQRLGLGRLVVTQFNRRCLGQAVTPLWDCFTNNAGSMALCRSAGFVPARVPYPFFTIAK
jgi:GNAT superfamily N-acetyltransferase